MTDRDDPMELLRAARPPLDDGLASSTGAAALALREEILAMSTTEPITEPIPTAPVPGSTTTEPTTTEPTATEPTATEPTGRRRRPSRALVGAGLAAAITAGVVVAWPESTKDPVGSAAPIVASPDPAAPTTADGPTLDDIELIAERSGAALGSGRAMVRFATETEDSPYLASSGTTRLAFSGDDIEMVIDFDAGISPAFTAENKTVGGEFYLLDGPPDDRRWVHDTNASGGRAVEIFGLDPRTLVDLFSTGSTLELVGTEDVDGVSTRHLRSTAPFPAPSLNLGMGPTGGATVDRLELWVGPDDVTRRIDLVLSQDVEMVDRDSAPTMAKGADGTIVLTAPDGTVTRVAPGERLDTGSLPMTTRVQRSTYSVTFSEVGAPISIVAPADAIEVAGVG